MSLSIDYRSVKDWETKCVDEFGSLNLVTQTIGFSAMWCNFTEITMKNWMQVYAKIHFGEQLNGALIRLNNGDSRFITPEDVYEHIGLRTNCTEESWAKVRNRIADVAFKEAEFQARKWRLNEKKKEDNQA